MELHPIPPAGPNTPPQTAQLMQVAKSLEAAFLSEMLAAAGIGETPETFGGGTGEDQFASFLREEHAKQMTEAGGIGLAQSLYEAMIAKFDE